MRRLALLGATLLAIAVISIGGLMGCGEDKGSLVPNLLPGVELTATPPAGDTTRYDIEFQWTGWDDDGEVDYFEYIIDPPEALILNPEEVGDTLSGWLHTDAYAGQFTFFAPDYDTSTIDNWPLDRKIPQIGLGYHLFAIRAVDDMGGRSIVNDSSWVAFTAATICPRTTITSPPPIAAEGTFGESPQPVGLRVTFRWEGSDEDGIFADKPVRYMYKLVDVSDLGTGQRGDQIIIDRVALGPAPWVDLDVGVTQVALTMDHQHAYAFGIRAVDEAGSVEPLLVPNRNLYYISASNQSSYPELTLKSSAFGNRTWQGWFIDPEEYEVPLGSFYEFTISGDAGWYGGLIAGYSYGWNLPDVETSDTDPNGDRAWTPWSTTRTTIQADFDEAEDQYLYIRCKDDGGGVTLATIKFAVVTLTADKELAYIDDWRFSHPRGKEVGETLDDTNWKRMLSGYDYGHGWEDRTWDEWSAPYSEDMPSLRFVSQFKALVWSINDNRMIGTDQKSAWFTMCKLENMNMLAVYLGSQTAAGLKGKVWAFGRGMVESCVLPHGTASTSCDYPYSVNVDAQPNGCYIRPRDFAYDFLHIRGQFFRNDAQPTGARVNLFDGTGDAVSYVYFDETGPSIADTLYKHNPEVDPEPYRNLPRKLQWDMAKYNAIRLNKFEVLEYPRPTAPTQELFFDPWLQRQTGLTPFYLFKATGQTSKANGRYCGFRYIPRGLSDHGEIVYFLFQMYPLFDNQARQTAKAVLTDMFEFPDPDLLGNEGGAATP